MMNLPNLPNNSYIAPNYSLGLATPPATPPLSPVAALPLPADSFSLSQPDQFTPPTSPKLGPMGFPSANPIVNPKSDQAILGQALNLLGSIRHIPQEEAYLRHLGLSPCFRNGQEALQMIKNNQINVVFGDMGDSLAHAQWMADQRTIMVNQKYRGDNSPATLYAISEALYHEAGHAANVVTDPVTGQPHNLSVGGNGPTSIGDDESSIQEELDCMALNSLAHGYHEAIDPAYAKAASTSRLLHDGVQLYYRYLLQDPDPFKNAIINRMVNKYGDQPLSSPGHEPPRSMEPYTPMPLANRIAMKVQQQPTMIAGLASSTGIPIPIPQQQLAYWA